MCVHPYIKEINGVLTPLPCGRCIECRQKYTYDWTFRLSKHAFFNPSYWFITLTYNDANLPTLDRIDFATGRKYTESMVIRSEVQHFMKRLRKLLGFPKLSYFAVGEYGKNNRAHYHILLFFDGWRNVHQAYLDTLRCWSPDGNNLGFVYVKRGIKKHIHYVCKYVNKLDLRHHDAQPFKLMSNGLGLDFLSRSLIDWFWTTKKLRVYYDKDKSIPLPRYYKKKLDELGTRNGLTLTQHCALFNTKIDLSLDNHHSYHEYFCKHFDEIFSLFKSYCHNHEIEVAYPDFTLNTCFDWFLRTNNVTRNVLFESDRKLNEISVKSRYKETFDPLQDSYDEIYYLYYDDSPP